MKAQVESSRQAALARDAATRRLRRMTQISVAVVVALAGGFATLAAGSTPAKKAGGRVQAVRASSSAALVQAPAPPLVGLQGSAPTAPAPPANAPATSYQPPAVVSGGS